MLNHLKKEIKSSMASTLDAKFPELSQGTRSKIADAMTEASFQVYDSNTQELTALLQQALTDFEQCRAKYFTTVKFLQEKCSILLPKYKLRTAGQVEINKRTNKLIIKGNGNAITDTLEFLNELNDHIMEFYEKTYKIKDSYTQKTLF